MREVVKGHMYHVSALVKKIVVSNKVNWVGNLEFADEEGQIKIVKGKIVDKMITLVGVYARQTGKWKFFQDLIKEIERVREEDLILFGDFNSVMNKVLDKSIVTFVYSDIPRISNNWLMVHVLRDLNKSLRNYTYYSSTHNRYSRLDYIFQQHMSVMRAEDVVIVPRLYSDHGPLIIRWCLETN